MINLKWKPRPVFDRPLTRSLTEILAIIVLKGSRPGIPNQEFSTRSSLPGDLYPEIPSWDSQQEVHKLWITTCDEINFKNRKKIKAKIIASVEYSKIFYFAPVPSRRMSSSRSEECIVEISTDEEDDFDHLRDGNNLAGIKLGRWLSEHSSRFLSKASEPTFAHCTNDEIIKNPMGGH